MTFEKVCTEVTVKPTTEPIFSEQATLIKITDESGGCFVEVEQNGAPGIGKIQIDRGEWPMIRDTIEEMLTVCERLNGTA